jgi:exopolysaccharide/PEP-CTERM locus tyrosine autokinase
LSDQKERDKSATTGKGLSSVEKAAAKLGDGAAFTLKPPVEDVSLAPSSTRTELPSAEATLVREAAQAPVKAPAAKPDTNHTNDPGRKSKHVKIDLDRMQLQGMVTPFAERSLIAEEFRLVKRPLLLKAFDTESESDSPAKLIMVASSRPGEGKTFCAISLAMSIASERDLTVLLIDADVAKPDVPRSLGFKADRGLVDLIQDETLELSDVMLRTQLDNLSILPAGRPHHLATELLASERMGRIVEDIVARYPERIIVLDSPPVLLSSIAGVLALHVGQILYIVEADKTTETALDNALPLVSSCKNINLLLNKSHAIGESDRFGYYSYYA